MYLENCINIPPILDFEASSLNRYISYPISAGLVVGGRGYYWEIYPEPEWTDWSKASEEIHGLSREYLLENGLPAKEVRTQIQDILGEHVVIYSDNPDWERLWANVLGLQGLQFKDVRTLLHPQREAYLETHFVRFLETNDFKQHNALHDAAAIALAVNHLF